MNVNKWILFFLVLPSVVYSTNIECVQPNASVDLDINNIRAKLQNGGDLFWDPFAIIDSNLYSFEVPKGSGKHSSFSNAIWFSGIDQSNNLHVSAQTYRQFANAYWPGPLDEMGSTTINECQIWNKVFNVYGQEIIEHKRDRNENYNIYKWPGEYAPYFDLNSDGIYDPSVGDYPLISQSMTEVVPGQMAFWIFNDVGMQLNSELNKSFLRFEIHALAYAFQSDREVLNNTIFLKYKLINKSLNDYNNFKFSFFHDFDIGNHTDDYSGCDLSTNTRGVKRNLAYVYNSDAIDGFYIKPNYGAAPPAIGLITFESNKSSSMMFNNNIESIIVYDTECVACPDPISIDEYIRRLMNGRTSANLNFRYGTEKGIGTTGDITMFTFPGDTDPNGKPAWYETGTPMIQPYNLSTIGLSTFQPGEVREVDYAVVWARDTPGTNLSSLNKLRLSSDTVIDAYNAFFKDYVLNVKNEESVMYSIYPNPSSDFIWIKSNKREWNKKVSVQIFDLNGKSMINSKISFNEAIDVSLLKEGVYILKLNDFTSKILINRK